MKRSGKTRRSQSKGHNLVQQTSLPMNSPIAYGDIISTKPPYDHTMPHKAVVQAARLNLPLPLHQMRRAGLSPLICQNNERTDTIPRASSLPLPIGSSCGTCRDGGYPEAPDSSMSPMHCEGQEVFATIAPSVTVNAQGGTAREHPSGRADLRIQYQTGLVLDGRGSISSNGETESPQLILSPTTINAIGMPRVREKIRRQLGHLFVYPLLYMMGWLIPFITHIVWDDQTECPFWLVLMSLVSLCIQGLADSVVFLMVEKPWRDWTRDDVAAWCYLRWGKQSSMKRSGMRVGRSREEMLIDGTIARSRRQRERTEHWPMAARRAGPKSRDWWDLMLMGIDESNNDEAEVAHSIG
ncbi:hypothetical protein E4U60_000165 [Claviceps pazoutovae]|uniref:G protein-coupled receptor GPR1/2/3 C-terminal domain-containing protein n=1 Tax=Claviceps pazoutovae TaxID=1649127 RepID=A0A9P7SHP5_9HYPO|nr:hypothetical protein E4U60_000165 [Claviceps pazoutovae]